MQQMARTYLLGVYLYGHMSDVNGEQLPTHPFQVEFPDGRVANVADKMAIHMAELDVPKLKLENIEKGDTIRLTLYQETTGEPGYANLNVIVPGRRSAISPDTTNYAEVIYEHGWGIKGLTEGNKYWIDGSSWGGSMTMLGTLMEGAQTRFVGEDGVTVVSPAMAKIELIRKAEKGAEVSKDQKPLSELEGGISESERFKRMKQLENKLHSICEVVPVDDAKATSSRYFDKEGDAVLGMIGENYRTYAIWSKDTGNLNVIRWTDGTRLGEGEIIQVAVFTQVDRKKWLNGFGTFNPWELATERYAYNFANSTGHAYLDGSAGYLVQEEQVKGLKLVLNPNISWYADGVIEVDSKTGLAHDENKAKIEESVAKNVHASVELDSFIAEICGVKYKIPKEFDPQPLFDATERIEAAQKKTLIKQVLEGIKGFVKSKKHPPTV